MILDGLEAPGELANVEVKNLLLRFSRLVAETAAADAILPLLADAAVDAGGADAAIVVRVLDEGASVAAARNLPVEATKWSVDAEAIGSELGDWALASAGGPFQRAQVHLLISDGNLFGALVLLFEPSNAGDATRLELVDALARLAATALAKQARFESLRTAHEDLRVTHDELRAAQATLVQSEKLRALGQMAAGVSHDLNNILNPLWLHLELLARAGKKHGIADVSDTAAEMKQVLTRGRETVERLRDYARQTPESRAEIVDLNAVVAEAAEIAKPRMSSHAQRPALRIEKELGAPAPIMGRSADVVSAVVNLVVNAIDAMVDGGTITLRTGSGDGTSFVEVADDGPGMSPDVERRVFEPFFTTKGDDGTGLGLAMVFACMQRHKGSVNLETGPGKGARFTLRFPAQST